MNRDRILMRHLIRKLTVRALSAVEPPHLDPSELDKSAVKNKQSINARL